MLSRIYQEKTRASSPVGLNADRRRGRIAQTPFDHGKPVAVNELQFIRLIGKNAVFYSILRYNVFFSFAINNWAQFCETFSS